MATLDHTLSCFRQRVTNALDDQQDLDHAVIQLSQFFEILWRAFRKTFAEQHINKIEEDDGYFHASYDEYITMKPIIGAKYFRQDLSDVMSVHCTVDFDKIYKERNHIAHGDDRSQTGGLREYTIRHYLDEMIELVERLDKSFVDSDFTRNLINKSRRFTLPGEVWTSLKLIKDRLSTISHLRPELKKFQPVIFKDLIEIEFEDVDLVNVNFDHLIYEVMVHELVINIVNSQNVRHILNRTIRYRLDKIIDAIASVKTDHPSLNELAKNLREMKRFFRNQECLQINTLYVVYRQEGESFILTEVETRPDRLSQHLNSSPQIIYDERLTLEELYVQFGFIDELLDASDEEWIILFISEGFEPSGQQSKPKNHPFKYNWLDHAGYLDDPHSPTCFSLIEINQILMVANSFKATSYKSCLPTELKLNSSFVHIAHNLDDMKKLKRECKYLIGSGLDRLRLMNLKINKYPIVITCNDDFVEHELWMQLVHEIQKEPTFELTSHLRVIKDLSEKSEEFRSNVFVSLNPAWLAQGLSEPLNPLTPFY